MKRLICFLVALLHHAQQLSRQAAVLLFMGTVVGFASCSNDNDCGIFTAVYGTVTDFADGSPLGGATVVLSPSGRTMQTDTDGCFSFEELDVQQYTLIVQRTGYLANRKSVSTISGERIRVDIQLVKK